MLNCQGSAYIHIYRLPIILLTWTLYAHDVHQVTQLHRIFQLRIFNTSSEDAPLIRTISSHLLNTPSVRQAPSHAGLWTMTIRYHWSILPAALLQYLRFREPWHDVAHPLEKGSSEMERLCQHTAKPQHAGSDSDHKQTEPEIVRN